MIDDTDIARSIQESNLLVSLMCSSGYYYLLTSLDVSSSLWYVISWSHLIVHSLSYLGYCRHLTHSSTVQQNYTLYNLCSSRVPRCSVILLGQCGCDVYVLYRCSYLVDIIQDDQIVGCGTLT